VAVLDPHAAGDVAFLARVFVTVKEKWRGGVAIPVNGQRKVGLRMRSQRFRFTISLLDVFSKIEALGRPERATGALFGGRFVVPPMRVGEFNMTSATEF